MMSFVNADKRVPMDWMLIAIVAVIALALLFDFTNGFHDAANSVATVVATRAMPARWAPWFSAFFNFSAFFVVGTAVANTVAKVVKHDAEGVAVVFAALIAAITWNYVTWYIGMPSSSSHAIIGGLVGAGLAAGGLTAINWGVVRTAVIAIVVSPARGLHGRVLGDGAARPHSAPLGRALQTPRRSRVCNSSRPPRSPSAMVRTTPRRRWGSWPPSSTPVGTSR